jgi:hypothetical protein
MGFFDVRLEGRRRQYKPAGHGSHELARKIEGKKMSVRDENRHLDIKRDWARYGARSVRVAVEKRTRRYPLGVGRGLCAGNRRRGGLWLV